MPKRKSSGSRLEKSIQRHWPIGPEVQADGGAHFRVWAPESKHVAVALSQEPQPRGGATWVRKLEPEGNGYFSGHVLEAEPGRLYRFQLDSGAFPDPASRFQPDGPHGASQIIDLDSFRWTDTAWKGLEPKGQVIYEMHIGTFTKEGTWAAAMEQLPELAALGITALEVMPVADFPGRFGWGYDGVNLFAPTRLYGLPDEFRAFVDRAHNLGIGVLLDVVYNHVGPDGNYLKQFSKDYFTSRYANEWGEAINFDGKNSRPVREFFITNAAYWVREYHLDGLRLDATQQIFDASKQHILAEITAAVREAAGARGTILIAENETQEVKLLRARDEGGYGMDAIWNDDFHHTARVALTGHNEAYYSDYSGTPQEFVSAMKYGFLYQGQWYPWQKKCRGTPTLGIHPSRFITFLENHDQVANSLRGLHMHAMTSPGQLKAMSTLLLLGPGTPMLFQGQEFAASNPFLYFADHNPELARLVAKGRRGFLNQFRRIGVAECDPYVRDPADVDTFMRSKLDFADREKHAGLYQLHRDLLKLRREDPVFANPRPGGVDGAVLGPSAFVLRFFGENGNDRLLTINLGPDLRLEHAPEPLLAPVEGARWEILWSSEAPRYGGGGTPPCTVEGEWEIPGHTALVLGSRRTRNEEVNS